MFQGFVIFYAVCFKVSWFINVVCFRGLWFIYAECFKVSWFINVVCFRGLWFIYAVCFKVSWFKNAICFRDLWFFYAECFKVSWFINVVCFRGLWFSWRCAGRRLMTTEDTAGTRRRTPRNSVNWRGTAWCRCPAVTSKWETSSWWTRYGVQSSILSPLCRRDYIVYLYTLTVKEDIYSGSKVHIYNNKTYISDHRTYICE